MPTPTSSAMGEKAVADPPTQPNRVTVARLSRRGRRRRPNVLAGMGGFIWFVIIVLPIYYVVITSVRPQEGFYSANQLIPPANPTLDGYLLVLQSNFLLYLTNSVVVTTVSVSLIVFVSILAADAIVRSTVRFVRVSFSVFLLGLAIPIQATIIPLFYMFNKAGLYDTLVALILPTIGFGIPFTVLILSNFMRDIPRELFESMRVDGASNWRILFSLVIPLSRPAIVTVVLYNAMDVWNQFLFPLILTQSAENRTLPLSLWTFTSEFTVNVPAILAAVVLSSLPVFTLYLFGRRHLVSGMTAGFSK